MWNPLKITILGFHLVWLSKTDCHYWSINYHSKWFFYDVTFTNCLVGLSKANIFLKLRKIWNNFLAKFNSSNQLPAMPTFIKVILFIHVFAGATSLITGMIAFIVKKGGINHRKVGKIYFYAMTVVFVTAIIVSTYKFIPFLFMIAFLSYYSVFAGVRILKLKQLDKGQKPKWYDWFGVLLNLVVNLIFFVWGIYEVFYNNNTGFGYLAIGFGIGGCLVSRTNLIPFITPPKNKMHWWTLHMANVMGGYIATTTAFSATVFPMVFGNSIIAWIWPSVIGVPASILWRKYYSKKFNKPKLAQSWFVDAFW